MFQVVKRRERLLFSQLKRFQERNPGRRLKGQEKVAHTLPLCHTLMQRLC
ncbi:Uncharacterised protein [Enterobacter cloacae]|nr:hypothetical protein AZZ64_002802 [Enterobacter cloacae]CZV72442.1 Uncharacterised protein [Enterobacter cloacae]CZW16159.1 Uncharacterised protein [Enterobacter cloacae]VAK77009.1 Uncharacterised protein [Enterobacter cloacae]